jgi:hypothetical protein
MRVLTLLVAASAMLLCPPAGASPHAAITGEFGETCRDFAAHASKDISHVVIRYVDGRVVKDETVDSPDFAVGGGPGDAIASVVVKSGTTSTSFPCRPRADSLPTAVLQIFTPPVGVSGDPESCSPVLDADDPYLGCSYDAERSVWTQWEPPGVILWAICPGFQHEHCAAYPFDEIPWTFDLRGSSSSDPDGDLTSWVIDFGDGTSASGSWATDPPVELVHTYLTRDFSLTVTLTVTDAAGHVDTDALTMGLVPVNDV